MAGTAATTAITKSAANNINFFNVPPPYILPHYRRIILLVTQNKVASNYSISFFNIPPP
jgi:hypothetical protein